MSSKKQVFFSFIFYAVLFSLSFFLCVKLFNIGVYEGILVILIIDAVIIVFRKMCKKHGKNIFGILFNRQSMSILFMIVPVLISFQTFSADIKKNILFIKWTEHNEYSISPSLISTLAGIMLYLSVVVRYRLKLFSNVHETIIICLNILFCASFLEIFCGKEIWSIPFINISAQSFLLITIILSWVVMRAIAGFAWMFLFILAVTRIVGLNVTMSYLGVIYILSAFVSIGLQLKDSVHMLSSFKNDFIGVAEHIGSDIDSSKSFVKNNLT
jgi:hypothetical protein